MTPLEFVDPTAVDPTYRVVLWAAPGQGKSVAAASAPGPILVVSADRPAAYQFARKHHASKEIREVRYANAETLDDVWRYLRTDDGKEIRTVILDPVSNIVDALGDEAPRDKERGGPDYQWINKKVFKFLKTLRAFDVNVVLVAHEKLNDGKKGDGRLYPALGGPALINKLLGEVDLCAHVERIPKPTDDDPEAAVWIGQLQPRDNLVCKEATGVLGDRRVADLTRWFQVAADALAPDDATGEPATPVTQLMEAALGETERKELVAALDKAGVGDGDLNVIFEHAASWTFDRYTTEMAFLADAGTRDATADRIVAEAKSEAQEAKAA
jgi:hypothetical protein